MTVNAQGQWLLAIATDAACAPKEGDTVSFTINGAAAAQTVRWTAGGAPADAVNGTALTATAGTFSGGTISASGLSIVSFTGTTAQLNSAGAAAHVSAVTATIAGRMFTYVIGAPSFVNADFDSAFPLGLSGTLVIVKGGGTSSGGVTPPPTAPPATPTPTPTASPPSTASGPGAPGSQFQISGSLSPFDRENFLVRMNINQSFPAGQPQQRLLHTKVCMGSQTETGYCNTVPPHSGEAGWYFDLPAAGIDTFVRVQMCADVGCGPIYLWGVVSQAKDKTMYVVAGTYTSRTQIAVFSLRQNGDFVDIKFSDGTSISTACSGKSSCGTFTPTTVATSVTVTLNDLYLGKSTHTATIR